MKLEKLKELNDTDLFVRFPFMFNERKNSWFQDWGWRDIQLILAEHIKSIYDSFTDEEKKNFIIIDVKEKFGAMRMYTTFTNEEIRKWIDLAEYVSSFTCIKCGKVEKTSIGGYSFYQTVDWICPYCEEHMKGKHCDKKFKSEIMTIHTFSKGEREKIQYDTKDFFYLPD